MLKKLAQCFNRPDVGLLIMRVVAGVIFILAGYPKFAGGADMLTQTGQAMGLFGITFAPLLWGVMGAAAELFGGVLLVIGFGTRVAACLLIFTMIVATAVLLNMGGEAAAMAGYPILLAAVCLGLVFTGPGKYAVKR